jgi:hypothetical protein
MPLVIESKVTTNSTQVDTLQQLPPLVTLELFQTESGLPVKLRVKDGAPVHCAFTTPVDRKMNRLSKVTQILNCFITLRNSMCGLILLFN